MIKKIVLELGKKEIVLTLNEAKELQRQLNNAFEVREVVRSYPRPYWYDTVYGGLSTGTMNVPICDLTVTNCSQVANTTSDTLFLKVN